MPHYPRPPRRPQAHRVRFAGRRDARPWHGNSTWVFCLAALALVAGLVAVDMERRADAAPAPLASMAPASARDGVQLHLWSSTTEPLSSGLSDSPAGFASAVTAPVDPLAPALSDSQPAFDAETPPAGHAAAPPRPEARAGRKMVVHLTAYSASVEEGTAWRITRSGSRVRPGVVAVDPTVIPLGSHLRIAGLPGVYRAEDTGSGVRGAHVDVYLESRDAAFQFGRRPGVLVEVLD